MPNQTTQLSSGLINGRDRLTVELVEPLDLPAAILIRWPGETINHHTAAYSNAASAGKILSAAVI